MLLTLRFTADIVKALGMTYRKNRKTRCRHTFVCKPCHTYTVIFVGFKIIYTLLSAHTAGICGNVRLVVMSGFPLPVKTAPRGMATASRRWNI